VTVSKSQAGLIADNLNGYSDDFVRKNITIYNPIYTDISYVLPKFDRRVCLGFFGGDGYLKGFDDAVNIVDHYQGGGSLKLLASKISASSSSERFEFFPALNKKEMADIFQRVWIVLFTSISEEPLPYIIVEAQMRGRPVVATSVGGVAETIVKPGFTGSLVERGKYEIFEHLIKEYSSLLAENSLTYTKEISDVSKEFFQARTIKSYDAFLRIIN
jgi:glycosyltransferase involved in cell wall biosynthesis